MAIQRYIPSGIFPWSIFGEYAVLLPQGMEKFPLRGATKLHIHRKWTSQYFHYYILYIEVK